MILDESVRDAYPGVERVEICREICGIVPGTKYAYSFSCAESCPCQHTWYSLQEEGPLEWKKDTLFLNTFKNKVFPFHNISDIS